MINLGEISKEVCLQCGGKPYRRKEKVCKLCARCGWDALVKMLDRIDDESKENKEWAANGDR